MPPLLMQVYSQNWIVKHNTLVLVFHMSEKGRTSGSEPWVGSSGGWRANSVQSPRPSSKSCRRFTLFTVMAVWGKRQKKRFFSNPRNNRTSDRCCKMAWKELMIPLWSWKTEILLFYDVLTSGRRSTFQMLLSDLCYPQLEGLRDT